MQRSLSNKVPRTSSECDIGFADPLVVNLNELLTILQVPINIDTPYDLTPSLLLAILESILQSRLPISPAIRASRDLPAKVQAMKVFLGVLEDDVLGMDVGLSDVDPRRLAAGEWDEVVFIGELLCWLGKKWGITSAAGELGHADDTRNGTELSRNASPTEQPRAPSSSTLSTFTASMNSNLSMRRSPPGQSDTTVMSALSDPPEVDALSQLDIFSTHPPMPSEGLPSRPRCIHEVDAFTDFRAERSDSDYDVDPPDGSASYCDCSVDRMYTTHAHRPYPNINFPECITSGADEDETRRHEASSQSHPQKNLTYDTLGRTPYTIPIHTTPKGGRPSRVLTRHNSPTQYTLALLNERARLLAELSHMKSTSKSPTAHAEQEKGYSISPSSG